MNAKSKKKNSSKRLARLAIVCKHVAEGTRPALLVSHAGGDLSVTCGSYDHDDEHDYTLLHFGHLAESDPTLLDLPKLPVDKAAERKSVGGKWVIFTDQD